MARDWSNLNNDMLRLIAAKFRILEDFIRTGAVCTNWRSGLQWPNFNFRRPQLPWLMLPCHHDSQDGHCQQCQSRRSFSLMENKVHHLNFPEAYGKKCVGSSHGWLIMVEDVSPSIFMLNPLTKQRKELPPVMTMPTILGFDEKEVGREFTFVNSEFRMSLGDIENFFTLKVILSSNPEEEDCIAVAICGEFRTLAFCRLGHDNKWIAVQGLIPDQRDVVYFKGKFYCVDYHGKVGVFDVNNPQFTMIHKAPSGINPCHVMYLVVDTRGKLLHISRNKEYYNIFPEDQNYYVNDGDGGSSEPTWFYKTNKFNIFELDEEKNLWTKVKDIEDNIIFIGDNHSICYSATEFPECNGNSIYFTDDYWDYSGLSGLYGGYDVGIFNIGNECGPAATIPCLKERDPFLHIFPRPVWFTPSIRLHRSE